MSLEEESDFEAWVAEREAKRAGDKEIRGGGDKRTSKNKINGRRSGFLTGPAGAPEFVIVATNTTASTIWRRNVH